MSIRNAKVEDAKIITEIAKNYAPMLRPSVEGTYEYLARCFSNTFFVYEIEGEIVGFIVGFPNTNKQDEFWIYQIAVLDKYRKKGIGTKLFKRLLDQVKKEGYKSIKSHYIFENKASEALHKKFGMNIFSSDERGYFVKLDLK